jgi:hypothetical protein
MKRFLGLLMVVATASVAHADEKDQWSCNQVQMPINACIYFLEEGDLITVKGLDVMNYCNFNRQIIHLYTEAKTNEKVFGCVLKRVLEVAPSVMTTSPHPYQGIRWWERPEWLDIEPRNPKEIREGPRVFEITPRFLRETWIEPK